MFASVVLAMQVFAQFILGQGDLAKVRQSYAVSSCCYYKASGLKSRKTDAQAKVRLPVKGPC